MVKKVIIITLFIVKSFIISAQHEENNRKVFIRVFSNFRQGLIEDDTYSSFEIRRVYIGYRGDLSDYFKAEVKVDIGSPDDLSQFSLIRRYAYFKTAAISYNRNDLTAWFGLFDMQQFKVQEDFWGYRYIYKSFQDENKFGPSADIGGGIKYDFSRMLSADLVLSNGEGYRNLEHHSFIKYSAGITLSPFSNYKIRIYYDYIHSDINQTTFAIFSGYNNTLFRIGGEYNFKDNNRFNQNHGLQGYSFYGTWIFNERWEVFMRYDRLTSNLIPGQEYPWNLYNDATSIISGCQLSPVDGLKLSLNYQDRYSLARNGPDRAYLFFNVQFDL